MSDTNAFGETENLLSPFCYSRETTIPDCDRSIISRNKHLQGFISEDCRWGCFFNNSGIQCFAVDTKISDYHYVPRSHVNLAIPAVPYMFPPKSLITCGCEIALHKHRSWTGSVRRILLGLDCSAVAPHYNQGGGDGALAIYDQVQQMVIKWIPLPEPVTNAKVLSHLETGDSIKPFYNGAMMAMVGIAAVGLKGGKVIIVDLGLDKTELVSSNSMVTYASISAPKQSIPFKIVDVDPFERLIATNRHIAIRKNELICLSVGDPVNFESSETFIYFHPNGTEIARFEKREVSVTALQYFANIGCLLVGFSFGGFQLWRVDDLSLQYSSILPEYPASVLSFGFQQPVDDPKNFCYVWVLYGAQGYQMSQAQLDLYQLFFLEKSHVENFGSIYNNLQKCAKSLSIMLEDVFLPREDSIEDEQDNLERFMVHPLRLWVQNELMYISWKVSRSELFYVGIFDLNQWYSSYTSARIPTAELGPFWVAIPVERQNFEGSIPWDFRVVPSSLQRWDNQYKQVDIHFYPSSITFQGVCLTSRGYFSFEHFGIQEKIIRIILRDGQNLMAEPALLRQFCYTYGLQPKTTGVYQPELVPDKDLDRYYVFTTLLESKRLSLIVKMANAWLDGSFTNVGCTIDLIIDWVKNLTLTVRCLAEEHWDNVFNLSAENMLPETKKFLSYSNFVWNSLLSFLNILMKHDEVYSVSRINLDGLKLSLEKLVQYSATLHMFYQANILPTNESIIESMTEYHSQQRVEVQSALSRSHVIPEEVKQRYFYRVIDQMVAALGEDVVRKEWNLESDEPLYPPRHAGYVVNMIMWKDVDFKLISRVVFYFVLDFMYAAGIPSSKLKGDFASVFHLNTDEQEEICNIFHVDHGYFDDPMAYLAQNPKFNGRDDSAASWATAVTIMAGHQPAETIASILKLGCPPFLGKLYINVMGQNDLLYKKLLSNVCKTSIMLEPDMLLHFFQVAMERNFLLEFITAQLPEAPEAVSKELVSFLEKSSNFDHYSLLLSYYATVHNIDKANHLYKVMKEFWSDERLLTAKQKEMWTYVEKVMSSWDMVKKENIVMDFLTLKRQKELPQRPTAPVITMKPKRIEVVAESKGRDPRSKELLLATEEVEMSPLRRFVSMHQSRTDSPESTLDDLNASTEVGTGAEKEPSRRSLELDVDSVLRTPVIDHRKSQRFRDREGSTNNSVYETPSPVEDMHSILKKTSTPVRSTRSRSMLKTRFMDPTSGEVMKSPESDASRNPLELAPSTNSSPSDAVNNSLPFEPRQPTPEASASPVKNVGTNVLPIAPASPSVVKVLSFTESPRDPNASGTDSAGAFVDADGSVEMSLEESDIRSEKRYSFIIPAGEELQILSSAESEVENDTSSVGEILVSPVNSNESVNEFEKNVLHGEEEEINLSCASTESGSISPVTTTNLQESRIEAPRITPEPEELGIQEQHLRFEKDLAQVFSEPPLSQLSPIAEDEQSPTSGSPPEDAAESSQFDSVFVPETPSAVRSFKYNTTFESTRIDESLFTSSLHEIVAAVKASDNILDENLEETTYHELSSIREEEEDEQRVNTSEMSMEETSSENILDLGPRRLTRSQKTLLEKTMGEGTISQMGEANLTPPKHSPVKEKSPARSPARSRGKSKGPSSVGSEDRAKSRKRVTETPESDASEPSRRITRRQSKLMSNLDTSFSGSQSSLDSQSDIVSQPERTTRSRSRSKVLELSFTEATETKESSEHEVASTSKSNTPRRRRSSTGSRAKSEPPAMPSPVTTPKKRGRRVANFAPDLSTVIEVSDTSIATTPRQQRYNKRRRASEIDSLMEEKEEENEAEGDASILDTSTSKRARRSVTPSSQKSTERATTPTRSRRRASSVK